MKVLILSPRLDVSFKGQPGDYIPDSKGEPNHPIRYHWQKFLSNLRIYHEYKNDEVTVLEKALWQFKPEDIDLLDWDVCYVPHKDRNTFPLKRGKAMYYMQTVFPEYFTVDSEAWGPGLSFLQMENGYPLQGDIVNKTSGLEINDWFYNFKSVYISRSKFEQPPRKASFGWVRKYIHKQENYILFLCQIPHDEIIKLYGFSVLESLRTTLDYARMSGRTVLVKGHPVNMGSMHELKALTKEYKQVWIENENIHDCIAHSDAVVTVNSGTGFETILHKKPLIVFGNSEYKKVAHMSYPFSSSMEAIFNRNKWGHIPFQNNIDKYDGWLYWFMNHCVNSENLETYKRINT